MNDQPTILMSWKENVSFLPTVHTKGQKKETIGGRQQGKKIINIISTMRDHG